MCYGSADPSRDLAAAADYTPLAPQNTPPYELPPPRTSLCVTPLELSTIGDASMERNAQSPLTCELKAREDTAEETLLSRIERVRRGAECLERIGKEGDAVAARAEMRALEGQVPQARARRLQVMTEAEAGAAVRWPEERRCLQKSEAARERRVTAEDDA